MKFSSKIELWPHPTRYMHSYAGMLRCGFDCQNEPTASSQGDLSTRKNVNVQISNYFSLYPTIQWSFELKKRFMKRLWFKKLSLLYEWRHFSPSNSCMQRGAPCLERVHWQEFIDSICGWKLRKKITLSIVVQIYRTDSKQGLATITRPRFLIESKKLYGFVPQNLYDL